MQINSACVPIIVLRPHFFWLWILSFTYATPAGIIVGTVAKMVQGAGIIGIVSLKKLVFPNWEFLKRFTQCLKITQKVSFHNFYFFALQSMIWNLFYAEKTMLIKLENLWYLRSKKVNFDDQYWLQCIKKVTNHRSKGQKINVSSLRSQCCKRDFLSDFQPLCTKIAWCFLYPESEVLDKFLHL